MDDLIRQQRAHRFDFGAASASKRAATEGGRRYARGLDDDRQPREFGPTTKLLAAAGVKPTYFDGDAFISLADLDKVLQVKQ